jgi:hypothetical protein
LRRERVASRPGSMVCATARRVLDPRNSWARRLRLDRIGTRRRRSATGRRRAEATHSHGSGSGRRRPVGPQVALMGSARDARSPSRWANPMMRRTGGVPPASQKDPTTCISGCLGSRGPARKGGPTYPHPSPSRNRGFYGPRRARSACGEQSLRGLPRWIDSTHRQESRGSGPRVDELERTAIDIAPEKPPRVGRPR